MEGKGGAEVLWKEGEEGDRGEGKRHRKMRWKEDGTELHALEKPQVARDLTTGEWSCINGESV